VRLFLKLFARLQTPVPFPFKENGIHQLSIEGDSSGEVL